MTAYTATFSNGQKLTLKNSKRANTHAWKATITTATGGVYSRAGWAGSEALAAKAGRATAQLSKPKWWDRARETRGRKFAPDTVAVEIVPAVVS